MSTVHSLPHAIKLRGIRGYYWLTGSKALFHPVIEEIVDQCTVMTFDTVNLPRDDFQVALRPIADVSAATPPE